MSFLLAHLSDAHIGPLPAPLMRELMSKRLTGYINWRQGRHLTHDMEVLTRLVADLRAQVPDHTAMTGDILNLGLDAEFPLARAWLESVGTPQTVSFTPGNHDAYTHDAMPTLAETFRPWTSSDVPVEAPFPYMRVRGPVALIGLSSGVPTAPLVASGRLGSAQRARLGPLLDLARERGLARVVLIHHPPHRAGAGLGRGLVDARALCGVLAAHGADLVLHGHNHRSATGHVPGPHGLVPIVGVPSCSAVPGTPNHRAAFHLFSISGEPGAWRITARARGLAPGSRTISDLGPLAL